MDFKEIKQIVDLMKRSELTEFEWESGETRLRIKRSTTKGETDGPAPVHYAGPPVALLPTVGGATGSAPLGASPASTAAAAAPVGELIKSPMVGTFYRAPNPDSPNFVEIGSTVTPDSVVCIIEAMKVMNEIQAEVKGRITESLVENGQSVEYGQPLFRVVA